jgi:hypothetical protein
MAYSAPNAKVFRMARGSLSEKICAEFAKIDSEMDGIETGEALQESKFLQLTSPGASTAGSGVDLGSGSDIEVHGFFFPVDVTIIKMHDFLTEAYVKDTTDAKIEVYSEAGSPAKLFTRTLTAAGEAVRASHSTNPESGVASVAAGTGVFLKAVNTGSSSGTGHAVVLIEYIER